MPAYGDPESVDFLSIYDLSHDYINFSTTSLLFHPTI